MARVATEISTTSLSLARDIEAGQRFSKAGTAGAPDREGEALGSVALAIAGIGIVLYSISMFLGVAG